MTTAQVDQTGNTSTWVCWGRGDSQPKQFQILDRSGNPVPITGSTFLLTVNDELHPPPGNEQFQLTGTIIDLPNSIVEFVPTSVQTDIPPANYYFDIQETTAGSQVITRIKSVCQIIAGITQ